MPTMSQDIVKTLPMQSRCAMTLEEIRDAMIEDPPKLETFKGGWASMENYKSNLRTVGLAPPASAPVISPVAGPLPKMLMARFYYWDSVPAGLTNQDPHSTRKLNAIDVIVTVPSEGRASLLFSTRTSTYLGKREGIIASLNAIFRSTDATIRIDRGQSHLRLADEEIFLWLAVQHRDQPQLAPDIRLDQIAGISSRDAASRTADLKFGVDFERSNFLTAVAEKDTLGPIDIAFVHHVGAENHSYQIRIHVDGGFEIRKNNLHFPPEVLVREDFMLETSLFLAYSMIPRLNALFTADSANWSTQRVDVIQKAMAALETRYKSLRAVLEQQLTGDSGTDLTSP